MSERQDRIAALEYDYDGRYKERVDACNVCGAAGAPVEVARRDRYEYAATTVLCRRCGLGYLSPRLTAEEYGQFYAKVYRPLVSAYHGRRIDAETVQVEQREYARALAAFLEPWLEERPRTVLDVGGSTGVVAGAFVECFGAAATVLDPAPDELAVAEAAGMETIASGAEEFDPEGRTWDLVLLCQTIDHLLDLRGTLDALRRVTAPGGRAFVDVLDIGFMLRRRGRIEGAVKIDHPYYLTANTARACFSLAGLRSVAERLSHDGHWGFVLEPAEPAEPDWREVGGSADELLEAIWSRRAAA
ncbi:MAG: methyltransferase domain-containing protein [Solirubrobacteraceae bacterium]